MIEREELDCVVEIEERGTRHPRREVKAQCAGLSIGIAAWEAAVKRHAHERVMLSDGRRVVKDTHPPPAADYPGR